VLLCDLKVCLFWQSWTFEYLLKLAFHCYCVVLLQIPEIFIWFPPKWLTYHSTFRQTDSSLHRVIMLWCNAIKNMCLSELTIVCVCVYESLVNKMSVMVLVQVSWWCFWWLVLCCVFKHLIFITCLWSG